MKVLIIKHIRSGTYSNYVLELLYDFFKEENVTISNNNDQVVFTNEANVSHKNVVIVKTIATGFFSFFQTWSLYFFIKKQSINWLVQAAEKRIFSSRQPAIIVPVTIEKLSIRNPLSSSIKILVSSQPEKEKLLAAYPFLTNNICFLPASANDSFKPVSWIEKQAIKMQYTQGKEYFITSSNSITEEAFTSLLKAFSVFKKWQHSSMKLVVTGKYRFAQKKEWQETISRYKYRDDVVMNNDNYDEKEYHSLLAGAYAFIHVPVAENDVIPLLQAMQCETPCLSFFTDSISAYAGDAAILMDSENYGLLSEKMIMLYKDEILRAQLIDAGSRQVQQYSLAKAKQALAAILPTGID